MKEFGPIEIGEIKAVRFDFSTETSAALSAPVVTPELLEGTDPAYASVLLGSPTVVGLEVVHKIQPGVAGCTYKLRCVVTDADGLKHAVSGKFRVEPA